MSKRNITYVKPEEPNFLKKLKQQIGYKEGPTVDTKREDLGPVDDDEYREDAEDELPTVVVLNSGDLSAEEASKEKQRLELEAENTPADLSTRIVFKAPNKKTDEEVGKSSKRAHSKEKTEKKSKKLKNTKLLSFNDEEENDD